MRSYSTFFYVSSITLNIMSSKFIHFIIILWHTIVRHTQEPRLWDTSFIWSWQGTEQEKGAEAVNHKSLSPWSFTQFYGITSSLVTIATHYTAWFRWDSTRPFYNPLSQCVVLFGNHKGCRQPSSWAVCAKTICFSNCLTVFCGIYDKLDERELQECDYLKFHYKLTGDFKEIGVTPAVKSRNSFLW